LTLVYKFLNKMNDDIEIELQDSIVDPNSAMHDSPQSQLVHLSEQDPK